MEAQKLISQRLLDKFGYPEYPRQQYPYFLSLILTCFFSTTGETIPPFLILKAKYVFYKQGIENDLDNNILFRYLNSRYNNDNLVINQLYYFIKYIIKKRVSKTQIFIIDSFRFYIIYKFFDIGDKYNIILFKLPAYSTYLIQPFNIGVFQPYKVDYSKAIQNTIYNSNNKFSRLKFLAVL